MDGEIRHTSRDFSLETPCSFFCNCLHPFGFPHPMEEILLHKGRAKHNSVDCATFEFDEVQVKHFRNIDGRG